MPTEIPHTTRRTPKTSSTSLGVERAIEGDCAAAGATRPGGLLAFGGTVDRTFREARRRPHGADGDGC
jgi:hypothetical protein